MKLLTILALFATLALSACDTKQEVARKSEIENEAQRLEREGKETKRRAADDADAIKRDADARAAALAAEAERMREKK